MEAEIIRSTGPRVSATYVTIGEAGYWELVIKHEATVLDILKALTYIPTRSKLVSTITNDFVVHLNFK